MADVRRWHIINRLIRHLGYSNYLEIGVRDPRDYFRHVIAPHKDGVDPDPLRPCRFRMTSDSFFDNIQPGRNFFYDVVLIDGLHLDEQVIRDVENSLKWLAPGGTIVLHDCNPLTQAAQIEQYRDNTLWNGTVWKAWAKLRASRTDLFMLTVDADHGVGVIQRGKQKVFGIGSNQVLDFDFLDRNHSELLHLVSPVEFFKGLDELPAARAAGRARRARRAIVNRVFHRILGLPRLLRLRHVPPPGEDGG